MPPKLSRLPLQTNTLSMTCTWYLAIIPARNISKFSKYHSRYCCQIPQVMLLPVQIPRVDTVLNIIFNIKFVFWLGIIVLSQISRSRFKQSIMSQLIPHIYSFGCFLGDFWLYLGRNSIPQRISKIYGKRKF